MKSPIAWPILARRSCSARAASRVTLATFWAAGGLLVAGAVAWLGLQMRPRSVAPIEGVSRYLGSIPLPANLPAPIERYIRATVGERVPRVESVVTWGTARMRLGPLWLPLRFQTWEIPGRQKVTRMEVTWFGLPVLRGSDTYLDGHGVMTVGKTAVRGPEIDQGENLALWGEALSTPSILLTDPRVRWQPIDETSARLIVPFENGSDELVVRVDPRSGLIREMTAERYRTPGKPKEPWKVEFGDYKPFHGVRTATRLAVTWERDRRPWSYWTIEGVAYNADVAGQLRAPSAPTAGATT